jgi:hypothetical protein
MFPRHLRQDKKASVFLSICRCDLEPTHKMALLKSYWTILTGPNTLAYSVTKIKHFITSTLRACTVKLFTAVINFVKQ